MKILFAGVFCVAFATLLAEISVIRILSFTIWHHFGYVIISTALLGYGASGTLLAVRPSIGARNLRTTLTYCTALSAFAVLGVLVFLSLVPVDPMSILSSPGQLTIFIAYLVFTAVPFFLSGLAISLALRAAAERVDRLYFWDLVGAGLGCASAVVFMNWLSPPGATLIASAAFAVGAAVFAKSGATRIAAVLSALVLVVMSSFASEMSFTPARSKHLPVMTAFMKMEPRVAEWTSLFRTDLIENVKPTDACKEPGLSRLVPERGCRHPRYFILHDASAGTAIYDVSDAPYLKLWDYHILRVPYLIASPNPEVLVIGVGGGRDVVLAHQYGASAVTGVELDPVAVRLLRDQLEATRDFFRQPSVELVEGEGRHFVRSTGRRYDLIQITGVDTLAAEYSGSYVLAENYLYTVESFLDYLAHLKPKGMLSISTGNFSPNHPRAAGRIASIAQEALRRLGIHDPERRIAIIDSRNFYVETMIRLEPFEPAEIATLATHAKKHDFRPLHLPGLAGHHVFDGLVSLQGADRERLFDGLRHLVHASTDDRPFFFTFYRWNELFKAGGLSPSHLTALGQIVIGVLVIALTLLGAVFVVGPLILFRRRGIFHPRALGILVYFLALGFGFMLFEISLIQRFVLFLGYPTYSLTVTLFSLLVFLGCGSYLSNLWVGRERTVLPLAVAAMALLTVFYTTGLPLVQDALLGAHIPIRIATTVLVLMPLGLVLGMFFPLGIRLAAKIHPDLVPWAWAINGCASVTGSVLTIALAMTLGFTWVWSLSVIAYAVGVAALLLTGRGLSH